MMHHIEEDRLYALAENPATSDPELDQHLSQCVSCTEMFGSIQSFALSLSDAKMWTEPGEMMPTAPESSRLDHLVAFSLRLKEEESRASALVEELRQRPLGEWYGLVRETSVRNTAGFARLLQREARTRVLGNASEALEIADLAIEVAEAIPAEAYPAGHVAQIRGAAWKERANALRYLGRSSDALWALEEAERHYRLQPVPDFDLATVDYVRGAVLLDTDRRQEGVDFARRARAVFETFGDTQRAAHATMIEAGHLLHIGYAHEAREMFMSVLKPLQEVGDTPTLAMALLDIAHCSVSLGDADLAGVYFLQSMTVAREIGLEITRAGATWGLGRLMASKGQTRDAIYRLREAEAQHVRLGLVCDSAVISLEIAEQLLIAGEVDEVPELCRRAITYFSSSGYVSKATAAIAYLNEALAAGATTPKVVRHVRRYFEELPREPQLLFLAPPE